MRLKWQKNVRRIDNDNNNKTYKIHPSFFSQIGYRSENAFDRRLGEKDIITDALVATDVNGLPYIPGTAIAGVVRSMLKQDGVDTDALFGFQKKDQGEGSQILFTEAKILNSKGEVVDGLKLKPLKRIHC